MSEWIDDPRVLDTLAALKGFQPGDEVQITPADDPPGITLRYQPEIGWDQTHVVMEGSDYVEAYAPGTRYVCTIEGEGDLDRWWLTRANIKAWRRP